MTMLAYVWIAAIAGGILGFFVASALAIGHVADLRMEIAKLRELLADRS